MSDDMKAIMVVGCSACLGYGLARFRGLLKEWGMKMEQLKAQDAAYAEGLKRGREESMTVEMELVVTPEAQDECHAYNLGFEDGLAKGRNEADRYLSRLGLGKQ